MLKARGTINDRDTVFIGLSFGNLQKFKDAPLDSYIVIKKEELNMPYDIVLFSGKTEQDLESFFVKGIVKQ